MLSFVLFRYSNDQAKRQLEELQGVEEEKKKAEESAKKAKADADQAIEGISTYDIYLHPRPKPTIRVYLHRSSPRIYLADLRYRSTVQVYFSNLRCKSTTGSTILYRSTAVARFTCKVLIHEPKLPQAKTTE